MKNTIFTGAGVAIVTPMHDDGSVNYAALGELIEMQIAGGTDAIIICGTTGESSTLTDDEHRECIRYTIEKVNKRIPVIAGTGSNDTAYAIELSKDAEAMGADGLLVVTPYYNKTSQRGLVAHYTAIADAVNIPIILYNVPSRTGVNISLDTYKILAEQAVGNTISVLTEVDEYLAEEVVVVAAYGVIGNVAHRAVVFQNEQIRKLLSFFIRKRSDERIERLLSGWRTAAQDGKKKSRRRKTSDYKI